MKKKTAQPLPPPSKLGLVFDFNAFARLEEEFKLNVLDKASLDKMELTPARVRQLVWAGLLHKSPDLTLDEAGTRIGNMSKLGPVIAEIMIALAKSFNDK